LLVLYAARVILSSVILLEENQLQSLLLFFISKSATDPT